MKSVIAERPSIARSIAAGIGVTDRQDGYLKGNGYLTSFADAALYGGRFKKWRYVDFPIIPVSWRLTVPRTSGVVRYPADGASLRGSERDYQRLQTRAGFNLYPNIVHNYFFNINIYHYTLVVTRMQSQKRKKAKIGSGSQ